MSIEVHMLPIKAGDATLLIDREAGRPTTVLIDAGLDRDTVLDYLRKESVSHLDLVILSHPDLDHIQGLLAVLDDDDVSIGTIWCFDLAFLRDFVTTGKIPAPQTGTHPIQYLRLLASLVVDDKILKKATLRGIRCLQVSEGYRTNVGRLHLEVLYPWDGFYESLRSPRALKKLLAKKWPEDWWPPELPSDVERELRERPVAQPVRASEEQQARLEDLLGRMQARPEEPPGEVEANPLGGAEHDENEIETQSDTFPISLIGTLYNNLSIVVRVFVTGGITPPRLLFPGDLTDWTYLVARRWWDLKADVFKYPHHGSAAVGVSWRILDKLWWPCPWPSRPWWTPRHWRIWERFWVRLLRAQTQKPVLFSELVRPAHTLVFPYPQKGLPSSSTLHLCLGTIHANRESQQLAQLADSTNSPCARLLRVG
ncbi:MAG: ComEC/Rec2 family competence protein [Armatimonadota bacterium]